MDDRPVTHFPIPISQFPKPKHLNNQPTTKKSEKRGAVRVLNNANTHKNFLGDRSWEKIPKGAYQILKMALPRNRKVSQKNRVHSVPLDCRPIWCGNKLSLPEKINKH